MRYFDTHAHLGLITEDPIDQLIVVREARAEGVSRIVTVSNNLADFGQLYENLRTESEVYHSIGISPSSVVQPGEDWEARIAEGTKLERVVAIGEIGLDYYRKFGDRDSQVELFIRQLDLAGRLNLPVIIHNRDAGRRRAGDPARAPAPPGRHPALLLRGCRVRPAGPAS